MLVDSEDMSKVRFICLRRSMPKIAPVFNGAHSNFVVRVFWAKLYLYGRSFIQNRIFTYYTSLNKVWFSCMGCLNLVPICRNYCNFCTCIKQKINLFLFYATFHKNSLVIVLDYRGKVATHSPNN